MANPCTISYKGTDYTYDGWMAELHDGLLDALIKEGSVAFKGNKGLVLAAPTKATKAILKKTQEETIAEILDEKAIAQDTKLTETQKVATTMTKAEFITQKGNEFTSKEEAGKFWENERDAKLERAVSKAKEDLAQAVRETRGTMAANPVGNFIVYSKLAKLMGLYAKKGVTKFSDFIKATGYNATQILKDLWDKVTGKSSVAGRQLPKAKLETLNASLFYHEAIKASMVADAQQTLDNMKAQIDVFNTLIAYANPKLQQDIEMARSVFQQKYIELSADLTNVNAVLEEELKQGEKVVQIAATLSAKDGFLQSFTDDFIVQKRLQEAIEELRGKVADNQNPYMQRDIAIGKVRFRVDKIYDKIFGRGYGEIETNVKGTTGMIQRMKKDGISQPQLDLFMYAQHAKERNARAKRLSEIRNDVDIVEEGSGMSDDMADTILSDFQATGKYDLLENYAQEFRNTVITPSIDAAEESGLISTEQADMLRNGESTETGVKWDYYIPLKVNGGMFADINGSNVPVSGSPIKKLKGTDKYDYAKRNSPFAQALLDLHASIKAAEENKVAQSLYRLVESNPNSMLWEIVPLTPYTSTQVENNSVKVKIDGKVKLIHIKHKGLSDAWQASGKSIDKYVRFVTNVFRTFNNAIRAITTTFNPVFGFTNMIKDIQDAVFNASGLDIDFSGAKIVKSIPRINASLAKAAAGRLDPNSKYGKLLDEYLANGGKVAWVNDGAIEDEVKNIRNKVNDKNAIVKSVEILGKTISAFNDVMETGTRLAVYKAVRDSGVSAEKAAFISKNLSVNFNKKGKLTPITNTLWLFSNAGIQSAVNGISNVAKSKKARRYVAGAAILGFGFSYLTRYLIEALSDDDEEKEYYRKLISQGEKDSQLIIPIGDYKVVTIPKSYGMFKLAFNTGENIGAVLQGGDPYEHAANIAGQALAQIDPISGNSQNKMSAWTPTALKPFVETAMNQTWNSTPIYPSSFGGLPKPDYQVYFDNVNPYFKDFTETAFNKTNGIVDVSPESLEYFTDNFSGGVVKVAKDGATGIMNLFNKTPTSVNKVPLVNKFYKDIKAEQWRASKAYYEIRNRAAKDILTDEELEDLVKWGAMAKQNDASLGRDLKAIYKAQEILKDPSLLEEEEKLEKED